MNARERRSKAEHDIDLNVIQLSAVTPRNSVQSKPWPIFNFETRNHDQKLNKQNAFFSTSSHIWTSLQGLTSLCS
jgi:hypothetical protein